LSAICDQSILVPSLYLVVFRFSFIQTWEPIVTVLYIFPSMSVTVAEGVTEFEAELGELLPFALVATTVKVYAVPLVSLKL